MESVEKRRSRLLIFCGVVPKKLQKMNAYCKKKQKEAWGR